MDGGLGVISGLFTELPRRLVFSETPEAGEGDSRNLKPRYLFALALGSTPDYDRACQRSADGVRTSVLVLYGYDTVHGSDLLYV